MSHGHRGIRKVLFEPNPLIVNKNILRAPGVADAKGGILVMLESLRVLEQSEHAGNVGWCVMIHGDDTMASIQTPLLLKMIDQQPQAGLTFEPALSTLSDSISVKYSSNFELSICSVDSSSSLGLSVNDLISFATEIVVKMSILSHQRDSLTINIGTIKELESSTQNDHRVQLSFNLGFAKLNDQLWMMNQLSQLLCEMNEQSCLKIELSGDFFEV